MKSQMIMSQYKDEYMSVEHLIIALFDIQSHIVQEIIGKYCLNKHNIEKIIQEMRGGHMVNNPNPEINMKF